MEYAQATLDALILAQALRPLTERAGPAGEYCAEAFARALVTSFERYNG